MRRGETVWENRRTFAPMFITKARKFHKDADGKYVAYDYYRLTKPRLTPNGRKRNDIPLCLGPLDGLTKRERDYLADMLTVMIEQGQAVMNFNPKLCELAMGFYVKYRETRPAEEYDPVLRAEAERKEAERRRDLVTISLKSVVQKEARVIGAEAVCRSMAEAYWIVSVTKYRLKLKKNRELRRLNLQCGLKVIPSSDVYLSSISGKTPKSLKTCELKETGERRIQNSQHSIMPATVPHRGSTRLSHVQLAASTARGIPP